MSASNATECYEMTSADRAECHKNILELCKEPVEGPATDAANKIAEIELMLESIRESVRCKCNGEYVCTCAMSVGAKDEVGVLVNELANKLMLINNEFNDNSDVYEDCESRPQSSCCSTPTMEDVSPEHIKSFADAASSINSDTSAAMYYWDNKEELSEYIDTIFAICHDHYEGNRELYNLVCSTHHTEQFGTFITLLCSIYVSLMLPQHEQCYIFVGVTGKDEVTSKLTYELTYIAPDREMAQELSRVQRNMYKLFAMDSYVDDDIAFTEQLLTYNSDTVLEHMEDLNCTKADFSVVVYYPHFIVSTMLSKDGDTSNKYNVTVVREIAYDKESLSNDKTA